MMINVLELVYDTNTQWDLTWFLVVYIYYLEWQNYITQNKSYSQVFKGTLFIEIEIHGQVKRNMPCTISLQES